AGVQLDALEARAHGRFEIHLEFCEILITHEAAFPLDETGHRARDITLVEGVARCLEARLAPLAPRRTLLLVGAVLQRAAEIALHEHFTRLRRPAFRQEHLATRRP